MTVLSSPNAYPNHILIPYDTNPIPKPNLNLYLTRCDRYRPLIMVGGDFSHTGYRELHMKSSVYDTRVWFNK